MQEARGKFFSSTRIASIALFSALSGILYVFGFPISAAFPSFLELNFSDIPALIGTFALGPVSGAVIVVLKVLIKLAIKGTTTAFVGDAADLLIGLAFVLPAGMIYRRHRTFRGALVSLLVGSLSSTAVAVLFNWLILVPFYVEFFFGGDWNLLVGVMTPLFPACTKENFYAFYLWVSCLPFNLMRCLIAVLVTLPVYKRISRALDRLNEKLAPQGEQEPPKRRILVYVLVGAGVLVVLIALVLLRYFVWK